MKKLVVFTLMFSCLLTALIIKPSEIENTAFYSKISQELIQEFETMNNKDEIKVFVIVADVDSKNVMDAFSNRYPQEYELYSAAKYNQINTDDNSPHGESIIYKDENDNDLLQNAIEHKRAIYKEYYIKKNFQILNKHFESDNLMFISAYSPIAIVCTNKKNIINIISDSDVIYISKFTELKTVNNNLELSNRITRASYVRNTCKDTGSGVKIGQIEYGVPDTSPNDIFLKTASITLRTADSVAEHASLVARILVGTDPSSILNNDGLAPDAQLYSCSMSNALDFFTGVEWLLSNGVNVINMSCSLSLDSGGTYDFLSHWIDHLVFTHDLHFVKSTGNNSTDISCPGMAYNVITVGGFNDNGNVDVSNFELADFSNYEECATNRPEKPNLVAPAVVIFNSNGTSFSTPQVAGTIAQLCSFDPLLKVKQSVIGAILAASSANKVESVGEGDKGDDFAPSLQIESNPQISEKEGAGILDSKWARGIAYFGNYWSYTINSTDFPLDKYVTIDSSENTVSRVAIFWIKSGSLNNEYSNFNKTNMANLDLFVYDPEGIFLGSSTTLYSNFEIVQFIPETTGSYRINIAAKDCSEVQYVGIAVW